MLSLHAHGQHEDCNRAHTRGRERERERVSKVNVNSTWRNKGEAGRQRWIRQRFMVCSVPMGFKAVMTKKEEGREKERERTANDTLSGGFLLFSSFRLHICRCGLLRVMPTALKKGALPSWSCAVELRSSLEWKVSRSRPLFRTWNVQRLRRRLFHLYRWVLHWRIFFRWLGHG